MSSPRDILRKLVDDSGLSLRQFASSYGNWDAAYLVRTLSGEKPIGPTVIGRLLVHVDAQTAAKLIRAYLEEQRQLIDAEHQRFLAISTKAGKSHSSRASTSRAK